MTMMVAALLLPIRPRVRKYAGSPKVSGSYDSATNWAMSIGIMDTYSDSLILRRDAVTLLYRYFTAE